GLEQELLPGVVEQRHVVAALGGEGRHPEAPDAEARELKERSLARHAEVDAAEDASRADEQVPRPRAVGDDVNLAVVTARADELNELWQGEERELALERGRRSRRGPGL